MSSSDCARAFESRYAAFIIWSIFILAFVVVPFLIVPIKFLIGRICRRCLGFTSNRGLLYARSEVDSNGDPVNSVWDVEYAHLSHSKKCQINTTRAREISKRVAAFSLELSAENMVNRKSSEEGHSDQVENNSHLAKNNTTATPTIRDNEEDIPSNNITKVSTEDSTEDSICDDDDAKYTHIRLPLPGYDKNGVRNSMKKTSTKAVSRNKQRLKLFLFRREEEDRNKQAKDLSDINESDDEVMEQNDDRRDVPIFCACLGEYELCDRVCWASSTECTHVFHHDCMLQWLKSLGKRACKQQRFSENPSVAQVLNFAMECPCCRQSFVDKSVDVDGNDANV